MSEIVSTILSLMILILGFSYMLQPGPWARLAKDAIESPGRYIPMVLFLLTMGLVIVMTHNIWVLDWPVVITFVGWSMTIKGIVYLIFPQTMKRFANWEEEDMRGCIRKSGIVITILGAVLVYQLIIAA